MRLIFAALILTACSRPPIQSASNPPTTTASAAMELDPSKATQTAPATYKARFTTTKGDFVIEVRRDWAPQGADRFYNLVKMGYYNDTPFFRVIEGFMVQFGINGDPAVNAKWIGARIPDDPAAGHTNARGMVSFATSGPNSRTTQVFINFGDNGRLDGMGFTPIGQVTQGMDVVDSLYKGYGEGAPRGAGPEQDRLQREGNSYTRRDFPKLDFTKTAVIE